MLAYGIGRIGCQLSGDGDWGIMADMALKPDWLPTVLWAQTYTGNILGVTIPAPGVYPTPIYETIMATGLFAILWRLRDHRFSHGWLFALYCVFAGVERWLIEKIRVNATVHFIGMELTQAEIISAVLVVGGLAAIIFLMRQPKSIAAKQP